MTKEETIRWFEETAAGGKALGDKKVEEASVMAIAALQEQEERRWISVTERLPESGERVIVCRGDMVEQGIFLGVNGWWKVYGTNTKKVTHWMPMPTPPKKGCEA